MHTAVPKLWTDDNGTEIHIMGGVLHRVDGPAYITPDTQEWWVHGKLHRKDGPARMFRAHPIEGERHTEWWIDGKFVIGSQLDHKTFYLHSHPAEGTWR